jgi:hypothetical protein
MLVLKIQKANCHAVGFIFGPHLNPSGLAALFLKNARAENTKGQLPRSWIYFWTAPQ